VAHSASYDEPEGPAVTGAAAGVNPFGGSLHWQMLPVIGPSRPSPKRLEMSAHAQVRDRGGLELHTAPFALSREARDHPAQPEELSASDRATGGWEGVTQITRPPRRSAASVHIPSTSSTSIVVQRQRCVHSGLGGVGDQPESAGEDRSASAAFCAARCCGSDSSMARTWTLNVRGIRGEH
jgi:hypothetical protein